MLCQSLPKYIHYMCQMRSGWPSGLMVLRRACTLARSVHLDAASSLVGLVSACQARDVRIFTSGSDLEDVGLSPIVSCTQAMILTCDLCIKKPSRLEASGLESRHSEKKSGHPCLWILWIVCRSSMKEQHDSAWLSIAQQTQHDLSRLIDFRFTLLYTFVNFVLPSESSALSPGTGSMGF